MTDYFIRVTTILIRVTRFFIWGSRLRAHVAQTKISILFIKSIFAYIDCHTDQNKAFKHEIGTSAALISIAVCSETIYTLQEVTCMLVRRLNLW